MDDNFFDELRDILAQAHIDEVIQKLQDSIKLNSLLKENFENDIITISANYSRLNIDISKELLSYENKRTSLAKISDGLSSFIKELEKFTKNNEPLILNDVGSDKEKEVKFVSYGVVVVVYEDGTSKISIQSTVFFKIRIEMAFRGVRGLYFVNNPISAIHSLSILLKNPISFDGLEDYKTVCDPVWWFRGGSTSEIHSFEILTETKCLINNDELEVEKIAVYRDVAYYKYFVYVETKADTPSGVYQDVEDSIKRQLSYKSYAEEPFCIFDNKFFSVEEHDDGGAFIDGKVIDFQGRAEFRTRFLTKYNFIIAAKFSPYNSPEFDRISKIYLDGILKGTHTLKEMMEKIKDLPKNYFEE